MKVTLMQLIFLVKFLLKRIKRFVVKILRYGNLLYLELLKTAFHFRLFHTHVYARKTLNPSTLYIF